MGPLNESWFSPRKPQEPKSFWKTATRLLMIIVACYIVMGVVIYVVAH